MVEREQSGHRLTGFWVLAALFAASIEPIVVKMGYRGSVTPLQLLVFKNVFAAMVILPLTRSWQWIGRQHFFMVLRVSFLLMTTNGLILFALKDLSAITVVTIVSATPAFVAMVNQWRGRDVLQGRFWLGFALCFAGVLLTINAFNPVAHVVSITGVLCVAGAVCSSTVYRTYMESVTAAVSPRQVSTYIFGINALLATVLILPWAGVVPMAELHISLWIGVAAALANFAFLAAIHLVGSTRMSIFDMLQRPLVIILAAVLLDEPMTVWQGIGVALVLGGVQLAKVSRKKPTKIQPSGLTTPFINLIREDSSSR